MIIEYKINNSSESDILLHFHNCEKIFLNNLENRINIEEYVSKIYHKAERFEAWNDNLLVGLIAIYINENIGYITNVSVTEMFKRQKIATNLLKMCITSISNIIRINLEVLKDNQAAINFYLKNGFKQTNTTDNSIYMGMDINNV